MGRMYLVPPAAAASQLLLTCLKSQREGRHHPGTSAFSVGAEAGGGSRTVTPLTPVLSREMVWPGRRGRASAKEPSLPGCTPDPCRAPPSLRGCLLLLPALWEWGATLPQCLRLAPGHGVSRAHPGAGRQSWTCTPSSPYHQHSPTPQFPPPGNAEADCPQGCKETKGEKRCKKPGECEALPAAGIQREDPTSAPNETPDAAAQEEQEP